MGERPEQITFLGNIPRHQWESLAVLQSTGSTNSAFKNSGVTGADVPSYEFTGKSQGRAHRILREIFELDKAVNIDPENPDKRIHQRKQAYFSSLVRDMRRRNDYGLILDLIHAINADNYPDRLTNISQVLGTAAIYLMACEPTKFIVGARDGIHWKTVHIPVVDGDIYSIPINYLANVYVSHLEDISRRELKAVPSRLIHPKVLHEVIFPESSDDIDATLEDAYYRQKYILSPGGAEINFRNAGDVTHAYMMQRGELVFTRFGTPKGEGWSVLNLNDGSYLDSYEMAIGEEGSRIERGYHPWASLAVETYHDLVTLEVRERGIEAVELEAQKSASIETADKNARQKPYVIYIPRRTHDAQPNESRRPYEGKRRPPRPHPVVGHSRKGNMTEKHRQDLKAWQEKTGIPIPSIDPGFTWVRPFFVPAGIEEELVELPTFIKNRIGKMIAGNT